MNLRHAVRLLVAGSLLLAACRGGQSAGPSEPLAVAMVNGEPVTQKEFQKVLDEIKSAGKGFFVEGDQFSEIKRDLLERMIDEKLLVQEAEKRRIVLDPKTVDATLAMTAREYPHGSLTEELMRQGKTLEQYRRETEVSLLQQKLLNREVVERIAVSREEIEKYYQEHRQEYQRPEEIRVRQIVTRTEEEAESLRKQILKGESFAGLAKKYSLGPERQDGGDLGYFPRGRMPPAIDEACFKLWSAQVSKPVASPYGFHLFELLDRRPARELSLQDSSGDIERKLIAEKTKEAEAYFLRTLREKSKIERDLPLLDRIH